MIIGVLIVLGYALFYLAIFGFVLWILYELSAILFKLIFIGLVGVLFLSVFFGVGLSIW
jgi:hypothetical protein